MFCNTSSSQFVFLPVTVLTDPTDTPLTQKGKASFTCGPTVPFATDAENATTVEKRSETRLQKCRTSLENTTDTTTVETASGPVRFLNEASAVAWAQSAAAKKRTPSEEGVASTSLGAQVETATEAPVAKALYAPRPEATTADLIAKAFHMYMVEGEAALGSKSAHLTRNDDGGFIIPQLLHDQIAARVRALCPMRTLARIQTVRQDVTQFMIQEQDRPTAAWMRRGGLEAARVINPKFRPIPLNVIYVRALASQKRLDDLGEGLEEWLTSQISQALARCENQGFLRGTGQQQPLGILRCVQGFVDHTSEASNENETQQEVQAPLSQSETLLESRSIAALETQAITMDALLQMVSALETDYLANASWLMSRSALSALQRLQDNTGHFLWQPSLSLGAPSSLFGYPVYVSDDLSAATEANGIPILFGDFKEAYTIVERGQLSLMRDPFTAKPYIEFYTTHTVGGSVVNPEALKGLRIDA